MQSIMLIIGGLVLVVISLMVVRNISIYEKLSENAAMGVLLIIIILANVKWSAMMIQTGLMYLIG